MSTVVVDISEIHSIEMYLVDKQAIMYGKNIVCHLGTPILKI